MINIKKNPIGISSTVYTLIRKIFTFVDRIRWKSYYLSIWSRFAHVGENITIDYGVIFGGEKNISIGDNVFIGRNVIINAGKGGNIKIGHGCAIGANSTIITWNLNNLNNRSLIRSDNKNIFKDVIIGKGVGIGYNVTINPGVILGDGCEVAAGSVVTQHVDKFEIVAGAPAVVVGKRRELINKDS